MVWFGLIGEREGRDEIEKFNRDSHICSIGTGFANFGAGTYYSTFPPSSTPARREEKRDQRCPYCGMKPDKCGCGYS